MPAEEPKLLSYSCVVKVSEFELKAGKHTAELCKHLFEKGIRHLAHAFSEKYISGEFKKNYLYLWKSSIHFDPFGFSQVTGQREAHFRTISEPYKESSIQDETVLYCDEVRNRLRFQSADAIFTSKFATRTDDEHWSGFQLTANEHQVIPKSAFNSESWTKSFLANCFFDIVLLTFSDYEGPFFENNYSGGVYACAVNRVCHRIIEPFIPSHDLVRNIFYVVWCGGGALAPKNIPNFLKQPSGGGLSLISVKRAPFWNVPVIENQTDRMVPMEMGSYYFEDTDEPKILLPTGVSVPVARKIVSLKNLRSLLDEEI